MMIQDLAQGDPAAPWNAHLRPPSQMGVAEAGSAAAQPPTDATVTPGGLVPRMSSREPIAIHDPKAGPSVSPIK